MELDSIYTTLILEASNDKRNMREIENPDFELMGHNPSCGDELKLMLKMDGDIVVDAAFTGEGCAISKASSSMMVDLIKGKTKTEVGELLAIFVGMIRGEERTEDQLALLKNARVFESIKQLPARVKCATLSWHTVERILE